MRGWGEEALSLSGNKIHMKKRAVPSPQDPYRKLDFALSLPNSHKNSKLKFSKTDIAPLQIPNTSKSLAIDSSRRSMLSSRSLASQNSTTSIQTLNTERVPLSKTLSKTSMTESQFRLGNITPEENLPQFDAIVDTFFANLREKDFSTALETFIASNINSGEVIYFTEIASLQRLYSKRLNVAIPHTDNIIGSAFFDKNVLKIPILSLNPGYNSEIDGKYLNPKASVILFQLRDDLGFNSGIVAVQKKFAETNVTPKDEAFIDSLQRRFSIFSQFINNKLPRLDNQILRINQIMCIEQFLLVFDATMKDIFMCNDAEIWNFSDPKSPKVFSSKKQIVLKPNEVGIAGAILSKRQIQNAQFSHELSSYMAKADGKKNCAILGVPIFPKQTDDAYVVLIRGTKQPIFTNTDEEKLKVIAPFVITAFQNSLKYSETPQSAPGLDMLQGINNFLPTFGQKKSLDGLLEDGMIEILKATEADRVTFYNVGNKKHPGLASVYNSGCRSHIKLQPGQGIAGHVASCGLSVNSVNVREDPHFDPQFDQANGYTTKSMLTIPIIAPTGKVRGVIQLLNKTNGIPFSKRDSLISSIYGALCTFLSQNAITFDKLTDLVHRISWLSRSSPMQMEGDKYEIIDGLVLAAKEMVHASSASLYVYDPAKKSLVVTSSIESNVSRGTALTAETGCVATCFKTGKYVLINDTLHDPIIDESVDGGKNTVCDVPLLSSNNSLIGVLEVSNKINDIFDDNDRTTLHVVSTIIALFITVVKLENVVENGKVQLEMSMYIASEEMDKIAIPKALQTDANVNELDFCALDYSKDQLKAIVFKIFASAGLIQGLKKPARDWFSYFSSIERTYMEGVQYHGWPKAVDSAQLMLLMLNQSGFIKRATETEKFAMISASLLCFAGHDATDEAYHVRVRTPECRTYRGKNILPGIARSKALHILEKHASVLLPDKLSATTAINLVVDMMLTSDEDDTTLSEIKGVLETGAFDIDVEFHRMLLLRVLFICSLYSDATRMPEIFDRWEERHAEERFALGERESSERLTYSNRHNCKELYNKAHAQLEHLEPAGLAFQAAVEAQPGLSHIANCITVNRRTIELSPKR